MVEYEILLPHVATRSCRRRTASHWRSASSMKNFLRMIEIHVRRLHHHFALLSYSFSKPGLVAWFYVFLSSVRFDDKAAIDQVKDHHACKA